MKIGPVDKSVPEHGTTPGISLPLLFNHHACKGDKQKHPKAKCCTMILILDLFMYTCMLCIVPDFPDVRYRPTPHIMCTNGACSIHTHTFTVSCHDTYLDTPSPTTLSTFKDPNGWSKWCLSQTTDSMNFTTIYTGSCWRQWIGQILMIFIVCGKREWG